MNLKRTALTVIGVPIHLLGFVPFGGALFQPLDDWWKEQMRLTLPVQRPTFYYRAVVFVERDDRVEAETRADYQAEEAAYQAAKQLFSEVKRHDIEVRRADGLIFYQGRGRPIGVVHEVFATYKD